jgi:hypothetical protein
VSIRAAGRLVGGGEEARMKRYRVLLAALLAASLGILRPASASPRVALGDFRNTGAEAKAFNWALQVREGLRVRFQQAGGLEIADANSTPEYIVSGSVGGPVATSILTVKVLDAARDVLVDSHYYPFGLSDALPRTIDDAARTVLARLTRPRPAAVLYEDPFTDPALANWDVVVPSGLGRDLSVEEGALRLRSEVSLISKPALPRDLVMRFQMRFEDNARAQLAVVFGSQAPYPRQHYQFALYPDRFFAQLRDGTFRNLRPGQLLALSPWQWYDVTVEVWNGEMRLWIDGQLITSVADTFGQLKGGNIGFHGSECWIDNVRVQAIDGIRTQ